MRTLSEWVDDVFAREKRAQAPHRRRYG